ALLLAAIGGHVGAIDPLVSGAAVVDARSPDQRTPLMLAAARGNEDAVRILLHHGANWYATDEGQSTASQLAAEEGHGDIVHLLDSAHLNDAESVAGDESFVPDEDGGAVIYSSRTRRLDGEALLGSGSTEIDLREELHMLAYRERQLPIYFGGDADALGEEAEVRLLFGEHETYRLRVGDRVPKTELGVLAIEVRWSRGKEGQGRPVRSVRLVVKDLVSGEVIGVTPDDPGRSAKSFALMEHGSTGQVYQVRRGDRFRLMGADFRVLEIRASEVLIEDAVSAEVTSIER
ncbi:MAG: ankyrin repeat domain-containing protein, partial [Verrucomicrobiales bacterium]